MHSEWRARLRPVAQIPKQDESVDASTLLGRRRYESLRACFIRESQGQKTVETYLLEYMLRSNGFSPTKTEVSQFEKQCKAGRFTFEDFVEFAVKCESVSRSNNALSELMEFFKPYDKENTGMIPEVTFKSLMLNCGERFSQAELETVLDAFKSAENMGYIDYRSFLTT